MQSFQGKVAVVTGGASGIGAEICRQFTAQGAHVCLIDIKANPYFVGDVGCQADLEAFIHKIVSDYGRIDYLIHNALPQMVGIHEGSVADFERALRVGVTGPFSLTKLALPYFAEGAAIVNISSSREFMSQPETESYSAAKGALGALTHSLAMSLAGKVRVNAISPGWIETQQSQLTPADHLQQPVGRVGSPEDIAYMVLYLCSTQAGFITGQNIVIDGGMSRQMIYHGDYGWSYQENH